MTFSIIVPVYNSAKYISKCIDSVLLQDFRDFELVLVDDGSKDESAAIIRKYREDDSRVKYFYLSHVGASAARNHGLDQASGNFIMFLDSDDWLVDGALAVLNETCLTGDYDMISFNFSRMNEHDGIVVPSIGLWNAEYDSGWSYFNAVAPRTAPGTFGCICGKVYSRAVCEKIRFDMEVQYHEDLLFLLNACSISSAVKVIDAPLYVYRMNRSGSLMSSANLCRFVDMAKVANKLAEDFISISGEERSNMCKMIASYYRNSLLWSPRNALDDVKREIKWPYFKVVSSISWKARMAYCSLRWFPEASISIIRKICPNK